MSIGKPDWRFLRSWVAVVVPLGVFGAYLVARYPSYTPLIAHGFVGLPTAVLIIWYWRRRLAPGQRAPAIRWLLCLWAAILLLDLPGLVGVPASRTTVLWFILFAGVFAGSHWLAVNRFGYRRADMSLGRAAVVGALALLFATLLYGVWHWHGSFAPLAGFGWVFVAVALLRALLRAPARGSASEDT